MSSNCFFLPEALATTFQTKKSDKMKVAVTQLNRFTSFARGTQARNM
jgi:hypothetical protein